MFGIHPPEEGRPVAVVSSPRVPSVIPGLRPSLSRAVPVPTGFAWDSGIDPLLVHSECLYILQYFAFTSIFMFILYSHVYSQLHLLRSIA